LFHGEKTDEGIFPLVQEGITPEKKGFQIFHELCNEFDLDQLVDKPTRLENILDLVLTNSPKNFSECRVSSLDFSDHNLVQFELTHNEFIPDDTNAFANGPEISKFNFRSANKEAFKEALLALDWDLILGPSDEIELANTRLCKGVCTAARSARVPKYGKSHAATPSKIDKLRLKN